MLGIEALRPPGLLHLFTELGLRVSILNAPFLEEDVGRVECDIGISTADVFAAHKVSQVGRGHILSVLWEVLVKGSDESRLRHTLFG